MKIIALFAAAVLVAGCSSTSSDGLAANPAQAPSAATTQEPTTPIPAEEDRAVVKIVIGDGTVSPLGGRVEVTRGQQITLSITSDVDEEIHVHSDPEHSFEIKAGDAITESFTVDTPGQVAVEAHHAGVTIVQLVVRP